jgi:5-enolpyruvylshikimate-3-phosphate synthase
MANLTTNEIQRIVSAGGGVEISADGKMANELQRIASVASNSGATVRIKDASNLISNEMQRIASAGGGNVIFVLD